VCWEYYLLSLARKWRVRNSMLGWAKLDQVAHSRAWEFALDFYPQVCRNPVTGRVWDWPANRRAHLEWRPTELLQRKGGAQTQRPERVESGAAVWPKRGPARQLFQRSEDQSWRLLRTKLELPRHVPSQRRMAARPLVPRQPKLQQKRKDRGANHNKKAQKELGLPAVWRLH